MLVADFRNVSNLRLMIGCCVVLTELLAVSAPVMSQTRLEDRIAAAAGAAAARAADRAVQHAVLHGAVRYRWPACRAGAREFHLRGFKHIIFMRECMKLL